MRGRDGGRGVPVVTCVGEVFGMYVAGEVSSCFTYIYLREHEDGMTSGRSSSHGMGQNGRERAVWGRSMPGHIDMDVGVRVFGVGGLSLCVLRWGM